MNERERKNSNNPTDMSPEITLGKRYDSSTDVYSFGIMLYEIMVREGSEVAHPLEQGTTKLDTQSQSTHPRHASNPTETSPMRREARRRSGR